MDSGRWPDLKARLTELFAQKTRAEWCSIMETTDVCFAPVLTMSEAAAHPHNVERQTFLDVDGAVAAGARAAVQPYVARTDAASRVRRTAHP